MTPQHAPWQASAIAPILKGNWLTTLLQQTETAPGWLWVLLITVVVILVLRWILHPGKSTAPPVPSRSKEAGASAEPAEELEARTIPRGDELEETGS